VFGKIGEFKTLSLGIDDHLAPVGCPIVADNTHLLNSEGYHPCTKLGINVGTFLDMVVDRIQIQNAS
jgi:hypothetical protein